MLLAKKCNALMVTGILVLSGKPDRSCVHAGYDSAVVSWYRVDCGMKVLAGPQSGGGHL